MRPKSIVIIFITYVYTIDIPTLGSHRDNIRDSRVGILVEEAKEQTRKEYIRRARNILRSTLNGRNIITAINSRAMSVIRYGWGIIGYTKVQVEGFVRKARKLLTLHGVHHPRADVDRLYLNPEEEKVRLEWRSVWE